MISIRLNNFFGDVSVQANYVKFGQVIRSLRRTYHETRKEFCDALEISDFELNQIESGEVRPDEDFIEQVIGHFSLDDSLAQNLWILGGYNEDKLQDLTVPTAILPISELKINYTDMVHVSVNKFGVVLNFMQNVGPNNQPMVVSRLGMSVEHAKSVVSVINRTLKAATQPSQTPKPKALPGGDHQQGA